MKAADLLVYNSTQDVQPSVIMEARAIGVPILCGVHPESCAHEFVKKGRSGLLFHSEEELIEKAKLMLKSPAMMQDMSKWCEQNRDEISWEACAAEYLKVMRSLLP
jgi:glycosyltransferase involved in cell wall biosynthesis